MKWAWLTLTLLVVSRLTRTRGYAVWGALFGFFLLDDAVGLHERGGKVLARVLHLPGPFGLRPNDLGELLVIGLVGVALLVGLWLSYRRGTPEFRTDTRSLAAGLVALVVCGVGFDLVHALLVKVSFVNIPLELLEDGGEMVCATVLLWLSWMMLDRALVRGRTSAPAAAQPR